MNIREQLQREVMLEHHILFNHYPRPPREVIDLARAAITAWNEGRRDDLLILENYQLQGATPTVTVHQMIEDYHLWEFIDSDLE